MFWTLVIALFASEAIYEALPDDMQQQVEWLVIQWQLVILSGIGYACNSYENTYRKAAMLIAVLWALYVALTDWWLPDNPVWIGIAEAAFFLGWLVYANWRAKKVQGLPEARHVLRDSGEHAPCF